MLASIREPFGWISSILTLTTFIYPIIPFIHVVKGKLNFENTPTLLICGGYCNCFAWYCYGVYFENVQIKFCNMIGAGIYLLLIVIYLAYETKKYLCDAILNALIVFNGTWAAYRALTGMMTELELLEKVCIGTTLGFSVYPLVLIYKTLRKKNNQTIYTYAGIRVVASGACWTIYGLIKANHFFAKWQAIGIVVPILEILLSKYFQKKRSGRVQELSAVDVEISANEEVDSKNVDTIDIVDETKNEDSEETDKMTKNPVVIVATNDENK